MLLGLPRFEYVSCTTLEDIWSLLSTHKGQAQVVAGGTDLLVKMKLRRATPRYLINIKGVQGLDGITRDESGGIRIGALTTIQAIKDSPVTKTFPVLRQAASLLGSTQIRNLATLGGNLCNASPAAECAPPLLTLEAVACIAGPRGERLVGLDEFFVGPGKTVLQHDELLTEVRVPAVPPRTGGVYLKYSCRQLDVAIVGVAVVVTLGARECRDIRIALGAVGPTPFRPRKAEDSVREQMLDGAYEGLFERAAHIAAEESFPIDDLRSRGDYRRTMVEALVKQGIEGAVAVARS